MRYYLLLDDLPRYLMSAKQIKFIGVSGYNPEETDTTYHRVKIPHILKPDRIAVCNLPDMVSFIKDCKPFCSIFSVKGIDIEDEQNSTISKLSIITGSRYNTSFDIFYEFEIKGANQNDICRYPIQENITAEI